VITYLRYRFSCTNADQVVTVQKFKLEATSKTFSDAALSASHEADKNNVCVHFSYSSVQSKEGHEEWKLATDVKRIA